MEPESSGVLHNKEVACASLEPICAGSAMVCHLAKAKVGDFLRGQWNWYWTDSLDTTGSTAEAALGKKMNRSNISPSGGWLGTLSNSALQDNIALSFILSKQASKQCHLLWPFLFLVRQGRDSETLYVFVPCALLLCFRLFLAC